MEYKPVILEKKNGIARVVFNKPEKLNVIGPDVLDELETILEDVEKDESVKVVVITGSEHPEKKKAFSAGADLTTIGFEPTAKPADIFKIVRRVQKVTSLIENMDKPIIAMVNGFCLGGGLEIALACDFLIASEDAELGQPETNLGIFPGWGGTQRLPRRVGMSKALELILTGERVKAGEAEKIGLVDKAVPREKLEEAVKELSGKLMSKSPLILKMAKQAVRKAMDVDLETGLLLEAQGFASCFSTEDTKEGLTAFREKRKPQFKGK